jgi:hypothetical protein
MPFFLFLVEYQGRKKDNQEEIEIIAEFAMAGCKGR